MQISAVAAGRSAPLYGHGYGFASTVVVLN
jgi:hypothetical protein